MDGPQKPKQKPNWTEVPPRDWAEEQAHRVALEVSRLRGKRTGQWLADRTRELGYPLTRAVISDIEVGRRRYVTTAELIVLARALDTAPIALLYPAPYRDTIQILPTPEGGQPRDFQKIVAVQWFSGDPKPTLDLPDNSAQPELTLDALGLSMVDQMNYDSHLLALTRARKASDLAALQAITGKPLGWYSGDDGEVCPEPFAWICYHHDMGVHIDAIFAEEIDALRFAVGSGYLKVAAIGTGEIDNLP
ncbi:hypothetical protein [Mycobacterium dioxanotrophicus]|nr:hypothetical protein [Mycobacterium dioxanotrophicus]